MKRNEAVRPLILCRVACCWTHFVEVIAFPLANGLFATIIRSELSVAKVSPFAWQTASLSWLQTSPRNSHAKLKYKSILQYLGVESTCQHFVGAKSTPMAAEQWKEHSPIANWRTSWELDLCKFLMKKGNWQRSQVTLISIVEISMGIYPTVLIEDSSTTCVCSGSAAFS